MRSGLLVIAVAACGDNIPPTGAALEAAPDLTIVAHPDDDLRFMQPDIADLVLQRAGLTTIYVTDGPAGSRDGVLAAYGALAATTDWACGWIALAGHAAEHCRLATAKVSVVFLGFPSGALVKLWRGEIDGATVAHYDQAGLIDAVAEAITIAKPAAIRTLDPSLGHGADDADRGVVGALAMLAAAQVDSTAEVLAFRGDNTADEPANVVGPFHDRAAAALGYYAACTRGCAPCGEACVPDDEPRGRYAVGFRTAVSGRLSLDHVMCMTANGDGSVSQVPCATAPSWQLTRDGRLHLDADRCMQTLPTDELVVGGCGIGPRFTYRLDDEGHLWTGSVPLLRPDGPDGNLSCLAGSGGRVRARPCGGATAVPWFLEPDRVTTARATLGLTQTGRKVRVSDITGDGKADLCELDANGLSCAIGAGDGTFAPAIRIDSAARPLAVEPDSLAIGDVDGDGRPDACGHVTSGILCALAADGFAAAPWSFAFAAGETVAGTAASLTVIDADAMAGLELCGLVTTGVICVGPESPTSPAPRSTFPRPAGPVWFTDLDGDQRADWCTVATGGLTCGRDSDRTVSTDGTPWSFALAGITAPAGTVDTTVFGDLDGDGLADRCVADGSTVVCARGQGYGFGPAFVIEGLTGNPLIGDLDGDGIAELCSDAVSCIR